MPPPYATIAHTTYALTVNLPTSMGLTTKQLETIARNLAREAFGVTFQDQVKVTAESDPLRPNLSIHLEHETGPDRSRSACRFHH